MTVFLIIVLVLILLILCVMLWAFNKAFVRTVGTPPQGVDKASFARDYPDIRIAVERGRRWYAAQGWERVERVSFDGLKLAAFFLPAEGERRGAILLMHGYRSDTVSDFSCIFEYYHSLGFDILNVNQRAQGESEGKYITFGVKERFDCQMWAKYLAERLGPDCDIFIGGMSMGGATVQMAADLDLPENVRGIIADCGFTSPWEELGFVIKNIYRLPVFPTRNLLNLLARLFAGFDLRDCSTLDTLGRTGVPFLFFHGEADGFVPAYMSEQSYAACASEKDLVLVPGADHGMAYPTQPERCREHLLAFLDRYAGGRGRS